MGKHKKWTLEDKVKIVKEFKKGATISYLNNKYGISGWGTISRWNQEYDEGRLGVDNRRKRKSQQVIEDIDILKIEYPVTRICNVLNVNRRSYYKWCNIGKPISNNFNQEIADVISEEHKNVKGIYGTIRLKKHIEIKLKLVLNHKLIRRYKNILGLETVKKTKKGLSVSRAKEKNLTNMAKYLIECNFKSEKPGQKFSSDVSYIKCSDGTLYLSAIKDYFNKEIVSLSTSNNNDVELIKESYKDLKPNEKAIINTNQGAVYWAYEYVELAETMVFTRSMSHIGHCWENCPIENWFMQLEHEWLCQFSKLTRKQAAEEIKKYVHWYNNERIQKNLGYLSPIQYRQKFSN